MYDPKLVEPMREELTRVGVKELRTAKEVDDALTSVQDTAIVVVNSVCGCAAGGARPGVALALKHSKKPKHLFTVFAGQDKEATERARSYFVGYPPSSPSVAIMQKGKVVHMVPRQEIEGHTPEQIAANLTSLFDRFC